MVSAAIYDKGLRPSLEGETQDMITAAVQPDVSESSRTLREWNQFTLSLPLLEDWS